MLDDLYQQIILEESKDPANRLAKFDKPEINISKLKEKSNTSAVIHEVNPSCGDEIYSTITIEDGKVKDINWIGTGCSISMASTSIISEILKGKTDINAKKIINDFVRFIKNEDAEVEGDLQSLIGVRKFPARVKCALLGAESFLRGVEV